MRVIGLDLSGPSNTADTALVLGVAGAGGLALSGHVVGVGDEQILAWVRESLVAGETVVGMDAPLSYQPGGGDRPGDQALRERARAAGLRSGSVMPPTLNRMSYLTLRGVSLTRLLGSLAPAPRLVEVHPGAALAVRGAPIADVLELKRDGAARGRLLGWLEAQGLPGARHLPDDSDHLVAAAAAALAAWKWARGEPAWCWAANPPFHPYDFAV